jgi:hypothetical protein
MLTILDELCVTEAFNYQYQEIVTVIGIEATVKLHKAFNGRRLLCVKHLYDIEYIVTLAMKRKDTKYIERLVYETGYSYDWLKKKMRDQRKKELLVKI